MENHFLEERTKDVEWLQTEKEKLFSLSNRLVEGKRAFLISTIMVSATIIAGLLIFFISTGESNWRFLLGAILFALSAATAHLYLTVLLPLESLKLDSELRLLGNTLRAYKEKMRNGITDPQSYVAALAVVHDERKATKSGFTQRALEFFSKEFFFILPNGLFVAAFMWLFISFLCRL